MPHVFHIFPDDFRVSAGLWADRLQHVAPGEESLVLADLSSAKPASRRSDRWCRGLEGSNEGDLQRALAHKGNWEALALIAGAKRITWACRELGDNDVVAYAGSDGRPELLLFDVKNAGPAKGGRGEESIGRLGAQAHRNAFESLPSLRASFPGRARLLALHGFGDVDEPEQQRRLSSSSDDDEASKVPPIEWIGVIPIERQDVEYAIVGRWKEMQGAIPKPMAKGKDLRETTAVPVRRSIGDGLHLKAVCLRRGVSVSLRIDADEHRELLQGVQKRPWQARERAHTEVPPGWRFVGESIEKGCARLHWEREGADEAAVALKDFAEWLA